MQPLEGLRPKFLNSDRTLEMGLVTSITEGRVLVVQVPFENAWDLDGRSRVTNRGGLPTMCNSF